MFADAFEQLMGHEGGYSNNPADPGGETMYGVTARVARANGYSGPMRDLPLETARAIAKSVYWDPYYLDQFDPRVAFQIFDVAYNGGKGIAWAQQACGVPADGKIGPVTMEALKNVDPHRFCLQYLAYRLKYLKDLNGWKSFSRGWADRVANNMLLGSK